jgi:hypothetical protein
MMKMKGLTITAPYATKLAQCMKIYTQNAKTAIGLETGSGSP